MVTKYESSLLDRAHPGAGQGSGMTGVVDVVSGPDAGEPEKAMTEVVEEDVYTLQLSPEEGDYMDGQTDQMDQMDSSTRVGGCSYYDYSSDEMPEDVRRAFSSQDKIQSSCALEGGDNERRRVIAVQDGKPSGDAGGV